jgi:O-antigen/teichoic acid export membrane protein
MTGSDRLTNGSAVTCDERPPEPAPDALSGGQSGRGRLLLWIRNGGFAVADQGLVSGSNFVISILLARWLDSEQYGAFTSAFAMFLLFSLLFQSLVLEPMAVFGGGVYRDRLRGYLQSLLQIQLVISLTIMLALGGAAAVAQWQHTPGGLPGALAGIGIAAPCILNFWLARRASYLRGGSAQAAAGAFFYCFCVMVGLWILREANQLSTFSSFAVMATAALLTSVLLFLLIRPSLTHELPAPRIGETWSRHWDYGRWALCGAFASWVSAYIYFPLLVSFAGLTSAADLKALTNLAAPLTQIQAAFSMLLIPYAAGVHKRGGRSMITSMANWLTGVSLAVGGAYWGFIVLSPRFVLNMFYSGKYLGVAGLLPAVAIGSILWMGTMGTSVALRAIELPQRIFTAYGISAILSLAVGAPLTWKFGLQGAVWGTTISDGVAFVLLLILKSTASGGSASGVMRRAVGTSRARRT